MPLTDQTLVSSLKVIGFVVAVAILAGWNLQASAQPREQTARPFPISLRISNLGLENEMRFVNMPISHPSLTIAKKIGFIKVRVLAKFDRLTSTRFRLTFVNPVVIDLVDAETGRPRAPQLLRTLVIEGASETVDNLTMLSELSTNFDSMVISNKDLNQVAKYIQSKISSDGEKYFESRAGMYELPELFQLDSLHIAFSLADLRSSEPVVPGELRLMAHQVLDQWGDLNIDTSIFSFRILDARWLSDSQVQQILHLYGLGLKLEQERIKKQMDRSRVLPNNVIPFPGKRCESKL